MSTETQATPSSLYCCIRLVTEVCRDESEKCPRCAVMPTVRSRPVHTTFLCRLGNSCLPVGSPAFSFVLSFLCRAAGPVVPKCKSDCGIGTPPRWASPKCGTFRLSPRPRPPRFPSVSRTFFSPFYFKAFAHTLCPMPAPVCLFIWLFLTRPSVWMLHIRTVWFVGRLYVIYTNHVMDIIYKTSIQYVIISIYNYIIWLNI